MSRGYTPVSADHITAERDFFVMPVKHQAYLVGLELYSLLHQLKLLRVNTVQAHDILSGALVYHDLHQWQTLKDILHIIGTEYSNSKTLENARVRYYWCAGAGMAKVKTLGRVGQAKAYQILQSFEKDLEFRTSNAMLEHLVTDQVFLRNLDDVMFGLGSMNGFSVRNAKWKGAKI